MSKTQISGCLHQPLIALLGTRAKVAVLRILWRSQAPLSYREVVRRSGMAYGSIDLALSELAAAGVVAELAGGRERRVQLEGGHRLIGAIGSMLQVEADFFPSLRMELRTISEHCMQDGLLGAALVGAVTRREERLGDAVEIVLISTDGAAASRCERRFAVAEEALRHRFGVTLRVITYDLARARAMWQTRTSAAISNVRSAEQLAGKTLSAILEE